jgi:hypothetical protein
MRVRRLAGLTAAGLAGLVVAPAIGLAPAAAVDPCEKSLEYGATAGADLAKLGLLDFRPLNLRVGPVADVTLVSTKSGMNAMHDGIKTGAAARLLDAKIAGQELPLAPLTEITSQTAPPTQPAAHVADVLGDDLGVIKFGVGTRSARATWKPGMACGKVQGENTKATAEIASATVLPQLGQGLAQVRLLESATMTGLDKTEAGLVRSIATAQAGVAGITLFKGTPAEITVEVVRKPSLRVGTAGTRDTGFVDYTSAILRVKAGPVDRTIDAPGQTVDLGMPMSLPLVGPAQELAASEGLPLLDSTLDTLLGGLDPGNVNGRAGKGAIPLPGGLPGLPEVPQLPPAGEIIGGTPEALPILGSGKLSLLKLSLGDVEHEVTDQAVTAEAATLRLQLLAGPNSSSLLDIGLGLLSADAVAPAPTVPAPPVAQPPSGGGGGLPITGANVGVIAAVGLLLLAAGGAMVVVGRRRVGVR